MFGCRESDGKRKRKVGKMLEREREVGELVKLEGMESKKIGDP